MVVLAVLLLIKNLLCSMVSTTIISSWFAKFRNRFMSSVQPCTIYWLQPTPAYGWERAIFLINLCSIGRVVCPAIVQTIFICIMFIYVMWKNLTYS